MVIPLVLSDYHVVAIFDGDSIMNKIDLLAAMSGYYMAPLFLHSPFPFPFPFDGDSTMDEINLLVVIYAYHMVPLSPLY